MTGPIEYVTVMIHALAAADTIEDAADLLRARADACSPGRWFGHEDMLLTGTAAPHETLAPVWTYDGDADHAAGLDPAVARAMADLLAKEAADLRLPAYAGHAIPHTHPALHLANTYLRKDPTRP